MRSPCVSLQVTVALALAALALVRAAPGLRNRHAGTSSTVQPAVNQTPGPAPYVKMSSSEMPSISNLRSHFKEDLGLDVPEEDVAFLAHGARYALSADDVEDEKLTANLDELRLGLTSPGLHHAVPPFPIENVEQETDVDAVPFSGPAKPQWEGLLP